MPDDIEADDDSTIARAGDKLCWIGKVAYIRTDLDTSALLADLQQRLSAAEADMIAARQAVQEAQAEVNALKGQQAVGYLTRLRDIIDATENTLRWYGDTGKYPAPFTGGFGALYFDCGSRARTALERLRQEVQNVR